MIRKYCLYLSLVLATLQNAKALSQLNSSIMNSLKLDGNTLIRRENLFRTLAGLSIGATAIQSLPSPSNAMYENGPVIQSAPVSVGSGVTCQDLRDGEGDIVEEGKRVNIQWVLKRSNGYDIDSSSNNNGVPFIFVVGGGVGESRAIPGLDLGIRGMRVGGIRRIVIPPAMSYVDGVEDGKPGPVPQGFGPKQRIRRVMELLKDVPGESIVLDVKATRVK